MSARPALGRGLNALIPGSRGARRSEPEAAQPTAPHTLLIGEIRPNPDQPRSHMDPVALEELAASIREHGVLQPLLVTGSGDEGYTLVAGERRWRAAQLAELDEVPVVVMDVVGIDLLTIALVENLQRQDLGPLEEAHAYERLVEDGKLTQQEVAKRVGKSRVAVANSLRLLQLPTPIRMSLAAGEISQGHARAILGAPSAEQQTRLWERVRQRNLTVRQTEAAAQQSRTTSGAARPRRSRELPGDRLAQERLQTALGTQVQIQRGRKGGKIVLRWYDDEQLEQIVALMTRPGIEAEPPPPEHLVI